MKLRLLQSLGQLGPFGARSRASSIPVAKSSGALRMRHWELAPYAILDVEADIDVVWRPGPPKARLRLRESLLKHLKLEQAEDTLSVSSAFDFDGERPVLELSGERLLEARLGASCQATLLDLRSGMLIVSACDRAGLRAQGHARELHVVASEEATVDCASLVCEIAIAELSGDSVALLRAESALQAEARDRCHLLSIGSPRIFEVRRARGEE